MTNLTYWLDATNLAPADWVVSKDTSYSVIADWGNKIDDKFQLELAKIWYYYYIYEAGKDFTKCCHSDFPNANLRFKLTAQLINKEARFLFGHAPDLIVKNAVSVVRQTPAQKAAVDLTQSMLIKVLDQNKFEEQLIKACKDCFVGKRVACVVNFDTINGITIQFVKSTNFVYKFADDAIGKLEELVIFNELHYSDKLDDKRIYVKHYRLHYDDVNDEEFVTVNELIVDGNGVVIDEPFPEAEILLKQIPAVVILNDGLLDNLRGISEISYLCGYEEYYSSLANDDIDALRGNMNPKTVLMDVAPQYNTDNSRVQLSNAPGSVWDLATDTNNDITQQGQVYNVESSMNYADALSNTLDSIRKSMYEAIDMPDIDIDSMSGTLATGKGLKAIYWGLILRCNEKMLTWGPALQQMCKIIIDGSFEYTDISARYYIGDNKPAKFEYEIEYEINYPLPEDEAEEKALAITEVNANVMSRRTYIKRFYTESSDEAQEEFTKILAEQYMLDNYANGLDDMMANNDDMFQQEVELLNQELSNNL